MSTDIFPVNPLEDKFLITFTFYNKLSTGYFKISLKFIEVIQKHKLTSILYLGDYNHGRYNLDRPKNILVGHTDLLANFSLFRRLT